MDLRQSFLKAVRAFLPVCTLLLLVSPLNAQWQADQRLTNNGGNSLTSYNTWCIAASPGGIVQIVWYDDRDGNWEIYTKRSTDNGATWGADARLTNDASRSEEPSIATSGSVVLVAWQDNRDGNTEIYLKRSTDSGLTWGSDVRLTNAADSSLGPTLSISGTAAYLVWEDLRDGNREIYFKRSTDAGVTWGADARLSNNPSSSSWPVVAVSSGAVHVAWWDTRDGGIYKVYYRRSTDGGVTWGTETRLSNTANYSAFPTIAASGNVVHVAWEEYEGSYNTFYKRSTDNGATWGADTRLSTGGAYDWYPSLAVSGSMVHVVWMNYQVGLLYKQSTNGGTTWGPDTLLTSSGAAWNPSIAFSGTSVQVVWLDSRPGNYEIYLKRNPTGNSGVEELAAPSSVSRSPISVSPNPFSAFTTVPGHLGGRFALYDISGRRVGIYRGNRIGEGLAPGVYFLRSEGENTNPLRIVKVR